MNCCYNCKERRVNCHSVCEKYLSFRKQLDAKNKKEREERYFRTSGYYHT